MNMCPRCGKPYEESDRFCGLCGYNLAVKSDSNFVTRRDMKVKDIQFDLGLLYFNDGKYQEAYQIFERIYRENPDNLQAINMYNKTRKQLNMVNK